MQKKEPHKRLNKILFTRVSEADRAAFLQAASDRKMKRSRLLRKLIREVVLLRPDPTASELKPFREVFNHLGAIGRNLNQWVRAANSGDPVNAAQVRAVSDEVRSLVQKVYEEFKAYLLECRPK